MYVIKLPRLGQTMESGIVTTWNLAAGAEFTEGQVLYEIETDKMTSEVEAKQDGTMVRVLAPLEVDLPVGTVLAIAADPGEVLTDEAVDAYLASEGLVAATGPEPAGAPETGAASEGGAPTPSSEIVVDKSLPEGRVRAVPKARFLAKEAGIDLRTVRGTGAGGAVRVADLEQARAHGADSAAVYSGPPRVAERVELRGVARAMAESVTRSWQSIPQFVQQVDLDATALRARLARIRYEGTRVTYTDLLISAVGRAAAEVPEVNATFADGVVTRYSDVNVSVAVASERGLVVPVVHGADSAPIDTIAARTKALAASAAEGRLGPEEMSGGTITVSNLGAFGIDTGTPLVNAPQAAIVFAGSLADRPVVVDGRIEVQARLNIAVAFDHRVLDGMTAARFTTALKARLEAGG